MDTTVTEKKVPRLEEVDPRALLVDQNVRTTVNLPRDFVDSIREHGVVQPIVCVDATDAQDASALRVRYGQRRTLGAIEAERATVTVLVTDEATLDEADRIARQMIENGKREGLTTADTLAGYEQMAAFGLSADEIAKRASAPQAEVVAALATAASKLARKASERYDFLTLDQAATVAEFEKDKDAVATLIKVAQQGGAFEHTAQRLRDKRAYDQAVAELTKELKKAKVQIVDHPGYYERLVTPISKLTHGGNPLTEVAHANCPGRAAFIGDSHGPERVQAVHVCTDPKTHGHKKVREGGPVQPLSEDEKRQRAEVRENNAAWRSAEAVRRRWLRDFLTRKTAPKGTATFIAACLASGDRAVTKAMEQAHPLTADLLGITKQAGRGRSTRATLDTLIDRASEPRSQVIALGVILAAYEDSTGVHTWRNKSRGDARYFAFLADNGYTLSEVETLLLPKPSSKASSKRTTRASAPAPNAESANDHASPASAEQAAPDGESGESADEPPAVTEDAA